MDVTTALGIVRKIDMSKFYPFPVEISAKKLDDQTLAVYVRLRLTASASPTIVIPPGANLNIDFDNTLTMVPGNCMDEIGVLEAVRDFIVSALRHEVSECLVWKGRQPLNPHDGCVALCSHCQLARCTRGAHPPEVSHEHSGCSSTRAAFIQWR